MSIHIRIPDGPMLLVVIRNRDGEIIEHFIDAMRQRFSEASSSILSWQIQTAIWDLVHFLNEWRTESPSESPSESLSESSGDSSRND